MPFRETISSFAGNLNLESGKIIGDVSPYDTFSIWRCVRGKSRREGSNQSFIEKLSSV
jgi:hypothetical protein|tara:strand:- start:247 stop:420 length:174 start_codon:yes stop_codon:yes gene_type:complete